MIHCTCMDVLLLVRTLTCHGFPAERGGTASPIPRSCPRHYCFCPKFFHANLSPAQDTKILKLAILNENFKDEKHMVVPGPDVLKKISSWTLRPPLNAAWASAIGIILQGQFYVYHVDSRLVEKANKRFELKLKAGVGSSINFSVLLSCSLEANKLRGVTISWGKNVKQALGPQVCGRTTRFG